MKFIKYVFLMAIMAVTPGFAFAGGDLGGPGSADVWTIYGFGNSTAIHETLRSVANFCNSSLFNELMTFIAVSGMMVVGLTSGFNQATAKRLSGYIVGVALVSYGFTGWGSGPLTVKVEVWDSVDGTWHITGDVPALVGLPAAVVSTAGWEVTKQIESSFMIPDELKLSNGAPFNLAAALVNDASKARITDPNMSNALAYYVQDCFTTEVARGTLDATVLLKSTDFIKDIAVSNQALMVNTTLAATGGVDGISELVTCPEAYSRIKQRIDAVAASSAGAAAFLNEASAWASTPALNVVNTAADSVAYWASKGAVTSGGSAMVKQAAVLSTFTNSYSTVAAATGNSDFLTTLSIEQAKSSQYNSWVVGAEMFNRVMGYVLAILQVFIYGLTPLVFMALLIPGIGPAMMKSFGQVLIWLALWQPLLAIVNFVVLSMQQADLNGVMGSGGGGFGMTLSSIGFVTEKTANMRAAASLVGTMVPMLAWGMVKGSIDMTKFLSSAAGEQFSASAASTLSTGNYSLNQASMDSFTANKSSISQNTDFGMGRAVNGGVGTTKMELGGTNVVAGASGVSTNVTASGDVGQGGQLNTGTGQTLTGTHTTQGGTSAGIQLAGTQAQTMSALQSLVKAFSLAANGQLGADFTLAGGQGGAPGAGVNGMQALPGSLNAATPGGPPVGLLDTKPLPGKAAMRLGGTGSVNGSATTADQKTGGRSATTATTGTTGKNGANTHTFSDTTTNTSGASHNANYSNGVRSSVTQIDSLANRADANRAAMMSGMNAFTRPDWMATGDEARLIYGSSSALQTQAADAAANPNHVTQQQQQLEQKVSAQIEKDDVRLEKERVAAEAARKKAELEAKGAQGAAAGEVKKGQAAANGSLGQAVQEMLPEFVTKAMGTAGKVYEGAMEKVQNAYNNMTPEEKAGLAAGGAAAAAMFIRTHLGGGPTPGNLPSVSNPQGPAPQNNQGAAPAGSTHSQPPQGSAQAAQVGTPNVPAGAKPAPGSQTAQGAPGQGTQTAQQATTAAPAKTAEPSGAAPGTAAPGTAAHPPVKPAEAPQQRPAANSQAAPAHDIREAPRAGARQPTSGPRGQRGGPRRPR